MPLSLKNVALVEATAENGETSIGTGYFVAPDRVLTARHVIGGPGSAAPTSMRVRREHGAKWFDASAVPAWHADGVDAVLLAVDDRNQEFEEVVYGNSFGDSEVPWNSVAYPASSAESADDEESAAYPAKALSGSWLQLGGGGQTTRHLDLIVDAPSSDWKGISGAPVFADGELVGIIDSAPLDFENKRLTGVPIEHIVQHGGYLTATTPEREEIPADDHWYLVVLAAQTPSATAELIGSALTNLEAERQGLPTTYEGDIDVPGRDVTINEELASPGHWLRLAELAAQAPVMVVDVTHHEPAIMMLLGFRAVARRGVTVTVTGDEVTEAHLKGLPFNIQETRLVSLSSGETARANLIDAIKSGSREMETNPDYLDLPAYDAVRGRPPPDDESGSTAQMLVLCPFAGDYDPNWDYIQKVVTTKKALHTAVRMLDIKSPRLVGQALYEQIRWNRYCLVDWTRWRPNVFFEMGVRLACSPDDPIFVINQADLPEGDEADDPLTEQRRRLCTLFEPAEYQLATPEPENPAVADAFERHRDRLRGREAVVCATAVPPGAIYQSIEVNYTWSQERVTDLPHEALLNEYEARLGKDPEQSVTETQMLFSSNTAFSIALESRSREDWLAAWLYASGRLGARAAAEDGPERDELSRLGELVLRALSGSKDAYHEEVIATIEDLIDEWELSP